jgi:hypothetical protein
MTALGKFIETRVKRVFLGVQSWRYSPFLLPKYGA